MDIYGVNGFYYHSSLKRESNKIILEKVCEEYNLDYNNARPKIKRIRKRLSKEDIIKILTNNSD